VGKGKEVVGSWRGETRVQDRGDRTGDVAGSWRVARNTATSVTIRKSQAMTGVPVTNGFNSLRDECEGGKDQEVSRKEDRMEVHSSDRRVRIDTGSVVKAKGRKVFVVGDSQVRYLDRAMQSEVSKLVCSPGGGVSTILGKLDDIMEGNGASPIVCLSVGGNDVHRSRSEELLGKYRVMLEKVVQGGGSPVVCGIVPRRGLRREWMSRSIAFNNRLEKYCNSKTIPFIDSWSRFYGDDSLYARDGVHFSRKGVAELASKLDRTLVGFP
ncbi:MAG: hypothetical protein GY777_29770, partial [Candidatus Brocadiaceae bacterium]|nr:hypothetical protein [Candidatus Brocadiaceae bacterium]